jgi:hypothetical protein
VAQGKMKDQPILVRSNTIGNGDEDFIETELTVISK